MSTPLLVACLDRGVQFWADGGELCLRAPKGALNDELRAALTNQKASLLSVIGPGERLAAVSYGQRRLWFLDRFQPGSSAHTIESTLRLRGPLRLDVLQASLADLVARHDVLRTTIRSLDGHCFQSIRDVIPVPLTTIDLRRAPGNGDERFDEYLRTKLSRTFSLETGPLFRAVFVQLNDDDACLVFQIHHIVADGWSVRVLIRDFVECYGARAEGRDTKLPTLTVTYSDWVRQQCQRVEADAGGHLAYWRDMLAQPLPLLDLPTDFPRAATRGYAGGRKIWAVDAAIAEPFRTLLKAEGATAFMGLLAVYALVLSRYTRQREMVIGYPVSGRDQEHTEELIGLFVNVLAIRVAIPKDATFRTLLRSVKRVAVDGLAHQEVPFERLVEVLQPERDTARPPLFQTMFAMQNFARPAVHIPGLDVEVVRKPETEANFDIALFAREQEGGFEFRLDYDADLFADGTIARLLGHLVTALVAAADCPDATLDSLSLVDNNEMESMLALSVVGPVADADMFEPVHVLFERNAAEFPDRAAIRFENETWTYRQLNAAANRIAHRLIGREIGREALVGLCVEPSPVMVAALIGIWKSGCAYVPLDPRYPSRRLADMAEQAGIRIAITDSASAPAVPSSIPEIWELNGTDFLDEGLPTENPNWPVTPRQLAYTIFTSGSTGRPKGVQIEHAALSNFLLSMADRPGLEPNDVILAVTTLAFDIAGLELFLPLVAGAKLVLTDRNKAADPRMLADALNGSGATVFQATPATYRMLLDDGWRGRQGLRLLCGGEAMDRALGDRLLEGGAEVWNMYGPTETTIWSMLSRVESSPSPITLGRPIQNTRVYVLDEQQRIVPMGVPGELYIGGAGLARGYLGQAALTNERFLEDPYVPGSRIYRTGDTVRMRGDGTLEYIGRIDNQIKLRGFRIEPREIEAALEQYPGISQALVQLHGSGNGSEALVAYCLADTEAPSIESLRDSLLDALPVYMVPTYVVYLDEFPLTPNGKIDRRALPAPSLERNDSQTYLAPRNEIETEIALLFEEILGVSPVGVFDDFFHLGGHSLLATQLNSRLRERFCAELPLHSFFAAPTVASVARAVSEKGSTDNADAIRRISRSLSEQLEQLEHASYETLETLTGE